MFILLHGFISSQIPFFFEETNPLVYFQKMVVFLYDKPLHSLHWLNCLLEIWNIEFLNSGNCCKTFRDPIIIKTLLTAILFKNKEPFFANYKFQEEIMIRFYFKAKMVFWSWHFKILDSIILKCRLKFLFQDKRRKNGG